MGFDEPRAHLIAALTLGSSAAAVAVLITGDRRAGTLLGVIGLGAFFGATLREETTAAYYSSGLAGVFDPLGYSFSIFTLVLMSLTFAWASATLGLEIRRNLARTWRFIRTSRARKAGQRWAYGRVLSSALVAVALVAAFSLFAQMIDFTPDIAFVRSGPVVGGLFGGRDLPTEDPGTNLPGSSGDPTIPPSSLAPGATAPPGPANFPVVGIEANGTLSVTPGAVAELTHGHFTPQPGTMKIERDTLPAPWTGGFETNVEIVVRLPAGYDPTAHYPTVYVTPNPYDAWVNAVRLNSTVDALEASGDIPPMIYVFAPATGGPHATTECIDSQDGLQHWDTFMSTTLIAYIDSHYATIADAAGRTIMGASQGAYCAAHLLLRHPDVWHQSVSFGGFYDASPRVPNQGGGNAVFGGDEALMNAYSPIMIAPKVPAETRATLFLIVVGLSSQDVFGPQMDQFVGILDQNGYPRAVIETPFGHSWKTEEAFLPRALSLIGQRLVQQGVLQ